MRRSLLVAASALGTVVCSAGALQAQGSAVMTHSSCATAMAAAGVAGPCTDGSAVLLQPGALSLQQSVVGVGWTGITTGGSFTYDITGEKVTRDDYTSSVPFGFVNYRFGQKWAAGIGVFNPYGLVIEWPEDFEGHYASWRTDLKNIYVQPTLSYQVTPWLGVGAGVDFVFSSLEINQHVDLATIEAREGITFGNLGIPRNTDFAKAKLTGDGNTVTFNLGAIANFSPRFSLGVRYLHEATVDFEGDADFTQLQTGLTLAGGNPLGAPAGTPVDALLQAQFAEGGALADQGVKTSLTVPAQFVVGAAIRPLPALTLLADYQWTGWSSWDEAPIEFGGAGPDDVLVLDYQDTDTYRLGAELAATEALRLRGGYIYNTAAQKDFSVSSLLPEAERNYYSFGAGYQFRNGLAIDAGYQLVDQSDRRGRVRGRAQGLNQQQLEALNVGVYTADASVLNVTLSYRFGGQR